MSYLAELATTSPDAATAGSRGVRAGLLDWASETATNLQPVLQTVAITVAVVFVIYKAVQSKFSLGTIVVSALAAGVFIWIVYNIDTLSDTIGEDLPGGSPAGGQSGDPAVPG